MHFWLTWHPEPNRFSDTDSRKHKKIAARITRPRKANEAEWLLYMLN
ncbi:hypothetical protein BA6E_12189 [Bacteroidales bacterium 6E]|nr:hypothetical protein BA6E_12189 [Bacteroidales bacterium 6E]